LVFKQLNFVLEESSNSKNESGQPISKIEITSNDIKNINQTITYNLMNFYIEDKTVLNIDKPSRSVRYSRRQILIDCRKRSLSDIISDDDNESLVESPKHKAKRFKKDLEQEIWNQMVSASSVRNYMLNDPLLDWLKEYKVYDLEAKPSNISNSKAAIKLNPDTFTQCIMDAGIEFEDELIKILKVNHRIIKVGDHMLSRQKEQFEETIKCMKEGVPLIYQAVLHNYDDKTFGMPDLLVRSDYINELMGYHVLTKSEAKLGSPKLKTLWHYKVIDIKHSNIPLRADGIHILNSESMPAYKGQLYIYTRDLNKVQGITSNKAYIWGKKYHWESKGIKYENTKFLEKLGVIDYDFIDSEYVNQTANAIEWIRTLKSEGSRWNLLPIPCRKELFPNMKNEKDGDFRKIKNQLNEKIKEITAIIYCGVKNREQAHSNKVFTWSNPKCTSEILGFNPKGKQAKIVDAVLDINRQDQVIIRPKQIKWDRENWIKPDPNCLELYLDFETLNSNFGSIIKDGVISYDSNQYIFMVGIGYENNGKWIYETFVMNEKNDKSELLMFQEFYKYVNKLLVQFKKSKAKFYHWSFAEPSAYTNFKKRHLNNKINEREPNYIFYDLYQVFLSEPVVVKGALNFSLKTIAKALNKYDKIDSCWDSSSPCSNGLTAMILANKLYESVKDNTIDNIINDPVMKEIIKYNEVDCKVMWEIHDFIRKNL
jgi:predicted RecB family nuclease